MIKFNLIIEESLTKLSESAEDCPEECFKEEYQFINSDENEIKCKEIDNLILVHFENKNEKTEKIGEFVAYIDNSSPETDYIIKSYNEVYTNIEKNQVYETFLIKEDINVNKDESNIVIDLM